MIEDRDCAQLADLSEPDGQLAVLAGSGGVTRRVVVTEDEGSRTSFDETPKDVARVNLDSRRTKFMPVASFRAFAVTFVILSPPVEEPSPQRRPECGARGTLPPLCEFRTSCGIGATSPGRTPPDRNKERSDQRHAAREAHQLADSTSLVACQ